MNGNDDQSASLIHNRFGGLRTAPECGQPRAVEIEVSRPASTGGETAEYVVGPGDEGVANHAGQRSAQVAGGLRDGRG